MRQQYKKIPNSWKYIRRHNQPTKVLSLKAVEILAVAMYQVNKYNQAILTHKMLKYITGSESRQNQRLIKQLRFIFNIEFSRYLIEGKKKYNNVYKLTLTEKALKILENPEAYFAEFKIKNDIKDQVKNVDMSGQNNRKDQVKNVDMSGQKCLEIKSKMSASDDPLLIYIKKLIYIINKKTNVDVDIDLYMQIIAIDWTPIFSKNIPEQVENFTQLLAAKSPFDFYSKDDSPEAYRDLHKIDTMDKLRTCYLTEFQKIGIAEAKRKYKDNLKRL